MEQEVLARRMLLVPSVSQDIFRHFQARYIYLGPQNYMIFFVIINLYDQFSETTLEILFNKT
jgi:hypothetical protein